MGKINNKIDGWIEDRARPQREKASTAAVRTGLTLIGAGSGAIAFLMWLSKHI